MRREGITFPRPADGKRPTHLTWRAPVYRNVIAALQNPFYAGAYAYGKSHVQTRIEDGRVRKTYGRSQPRDRWTALVRDHHDAYISWEQFEQHQRRLARLRRAGLEAVVELELCLLQSQRFLRR